MAEIGGMLAAGVLKAAAAKVAAAAGNRVMLQWRFGEDLEDMKDTMESIEAVLEDAERRSIVDASVRLWLKRLTRASYDISDMFEEFEGNTTRKSALRKIKVLKPCLTLAPEVGMAGKMKKVREKLENISNHHHKFSFTAGGSSNIQQVIDERTTSSEVIEANILGRDQEKQIVTDILTRASMSSEFIILPIYGIGGIGKTTLAQLLFNDTHFNDYEKAWVYVSQTFDLNKIKDSVRSQLQLEQGQLANTQEQDADPLARMKILIVLDDLWEKGDFKLDDLKRYLKMVGNGRKVHAIVTTRDAVIAQKIQTTESYKIEPLSDDTCWTIIKQIVGFDDRSDKEKLEGIGKEIAQKCGGVALAARALGCMLRFMSFNGWVSVKDNGIWNVSGSSYTPLPYDNVLASLKLSYSSMLPYLRLCFAYCAIFPKGHKMAKDNLICQWAALGFIKPSDEVSMWQHGENCIKQLLGAVLLSTFSVTFDKLLLLQSSGQHNNDVTLFTMHDLVHDLARTIMGDEVLDASKKFNIGGSNCRYAFLADCSKPLKTFVTYPDKIRSLRFLGSDNIGQCSAGFSAARYLRVLDLGECSLEKLPSSIGRLKQLRYLDVPGIKERMIPSCITKLSKLIYLSLRGSSAILALPESIGEMEGLMYLDLSGCSGIRKLPKSFGKLENLVHVDLSNCSNVRDLSYSWGNLTQLQYLNLSGCQQLEELPRSFGKLENLVHLNISYCSQINGISEALHSLTKLQYLNLSRKWRWSHIKRSPPLRGLHEVLGNLTELRYLNLSKCVNSSEVGEISDCMDSFLDSISTLSNLEHLDLSFTGDLEVVPDNFCSLRKLHTLDLTCCPRLHRLPENTCDMDSLKFLIVKDCFNLDMSNLRINKSSILLPHFIVHIAEGELSSNLVLLKDFNPPELEISLLENVKSIEEARQIELRKKLSMVKLTLEWTRGKKRFVNDMELLRELVPPSSLSGFELRGYSGVSFPPWLMGIAIYLPNLVRVKLMGLSQCSSLPPLGQLPKLKYLDLEEMPSITKIDSDRGFCDSKKAFAKLEELSISDMESLDEWSAACSGGEGVVDGFMFPNLRKLTIRKCHKLRVKPCPPRVKGTWHIIRSDAVLLHWGESVPHCGFSASSSLVDTLWVKSCKAPVHQWKLLRHLPNLSWLFIDDCNHLSSSPKFSGVLRSLRKLTLKSCGRMTSLPQWLGNLTSLYILALVNCSGIKTLPEWLSDLVSLNELYIESCEGIISLPGSIQRLTKLEKLTVYRCPKLRKWCERDENTIKIGHIKVKNFRF